MRIEIKSFGALDYFKYDFEDHLNIIKSRYVDEIIHAIRLVLGHSSHSLPDYRVRSDTEIKARVCAEGKEYRIVIRNRLNKNHLCLYAYDKNAKNLTKEYLYLTSHCTEQDLSDVFCGDTDTDAFKLIQYLDEDRYYASKELSVRTDKLSETQAFRSHLKSFIKNFQPEQICEGKRYELCLEKSGKYAVRYKDDDNMPVSLSESEQTLSRYLCFLKTSEFWHSFEELRNLHSIKKPLLVKGLLERIDESINMYDILNRTKQLDRQTIMLRM